MSRSLCGGKAIARLLLLWLLVIGSGAAALVYEVIWFQLLQLIIGSSTISLGVLLATFMGGMCLGSFLVPRMIRRHVHPLRAYAALEAGIAIAALVLLWTAPAIDTAYAHVGAVSVVIRALVAALCLLPPTMLMGATLPVIARWVETTPRGVAWFGYLYGGNIAGAVVGCLVAGLYLLRFYDVAIGTYVAALVNVTVATAAWFMAGDGRTYTAPDRSVAPAVAMTSPDRRVYVALALSGLTALASQVVWTRLLSLLFGGTVYTFALLLAVFLFGLGPGSVAGAAYSRRTADPRRALGWTQLLVGAAMSWAGYSLLARLPFVPIDAAAMSDPANAYSSNGSWE